MDLEWIGTDDRNGLTYWWGGGRQVFVKVDGHLSFGSFLPCDGTREGAERIVRQTIARTPKLDKWDKSYV